MKKRRRLQLPEMNLAPPYFALKPGERRPLDSPPDFRPVLVADYQPGHYATANQSPVWYYAVEFDGGPLDYAKLDQVWRWGQPQVEDGDKTLLPGHSYQRTIPYSRTLLIGFGVGGNDECYCWVAGSVLSNNSMSWSALKWPGGSDSGVIDDWVKRTYRTSVTDTLIEVDWAPDNNGGLVWGWSTPHGGHLNDIKAGKIALE